MAFFFRALRSLFSGKYYKRNVSKRTHHIRGTATAFAFSFVTVISVGALLLSLPVSRIDGTHNLVDAAFTSTSAVCITGLTVSDTGLTYTFWGQLIILLLVQIGALGYMTVAVVVALLMGKRLGIASAVHIMESNGETHLAGMHRLAKNTVIFTLCVEGAGAALYFFRFAAMPELGFSCRSVWYALFHSVMSFCNAGIDLMGPIYGKGTGFTHFCGDIYFCSVLSLLVFLGSLGYAVFADLAVPLKAGNIHLSQLFRNVFSLENRRKRSTHTVIALNTTLILIVLGAVILFCSEYSSGFAGLPLWKKLVMSVSESVTCRTAGFTTLNTASLPVWCLLLLGPLMLIGGCPVSTAGGIKTTTVAVLYGALRSALTGRQDVEICSRRVSQICLNRAIAVTTIAIAFVIIIQMLLCFTEGPNVSSDLSKLQFESVSALGTVGLSTGVTGALSPLGKLIFIVSMYIGRIGSIFFNMVVFSDKKLMRRLPEDDIIIG
ncbi:MAG: hypothetical protein ILO36_04670 [Abditibacteriota bacterium]|nr:hypothetical protein [Abditibacteriota bacterium]